MITYRDYEKQVYDWLIAKHEIDENFTFSLRQKGSKGSELDYFIGTEKSNYFGLTFWSIPVGYPGSASDLIDVFFEQKEDGFKFFFEFGQTMYPTDDQNISALNLIRNIKENIRALGEITYETTEDLKMFKYSLGSPKSRYSTLNDLFSDLEKTLNSIIPIVENGIIDEKKINPNFIANLISTEQFKEIHQKLENRLLKYKHIADYENDSTIPFDKFINNFEEKDLKVFFDFLKEIVSHFDLKVNDERLVFNTHTNTRYLSFTIGQRYCFMLSNNAEKGKFGFISKDKLFNNSEPFKGNHPRPWFSRLNEFNLDESQKQNVFKAIEIELNRTDKSGFRKFNKSEFEEIIFGKSISENNTQTNNYALNNKINNSLNTILYGPPGTGKTYNSINKAIEIINPDFDIKQDRKIIKAEYDRLVNEGRIVFTTFHQSMSYEDFIEGIKPKIEEDINENKQVVYEIEDGIFKRLVNKAKQFNNDNKTGEIQYSFDDAWDDLIKEAEQNIEKNTPLFLKIQTPNLGLKIVEISERGNLNLKPIYSEEAKTYTVSYTRAKKLQEVFPDLSKVKNIDKEFRSVIGGSNSTAYWSILNVINSKIKTNSLSINEPTTSTKLPYVIIIDEINRGNISSIFGELITLIEESKRIGEVEELEVILPYSKSKFSVPSNLFIIGTMNTADRSVEALDTALRRRFSFIEMMPDYKIKELEYLIYNFKVTNILKKINTRIEMLLGRDYVIGHSYFLEKTSSEINEIKKAMEVLNLLLESKNSKHENFELKIELDKLKKLLIEKESNKNKNDALNLLNSFDKNIIPLLQEYFYNDYGKIGLVLGKGFVREKAITAKNDKSIFADFDTKNEVDITKSYELIPFAEIDFKDAINTLLV